MYFRFVSPMTLVLIGGMAFVPQSLLAGPPYQTDDPIPADEGHYEIYAAYELEKTREGRSGAAPILELNYGAAEDLQIGIAVPFAFDDPKHGSSHVGVGDVEIGAKYQFVHETDSLPAVSFYPTVVAPTGDADKHLGNGASQILLPLWVQKNWGAWQTNLGGGYGINRAGDAKNQWFFGWQLQKRLSQQWTLGGEVFHSTEEARDEGSSSGFNLGAVLDLDERNHVLLSAGRGIRNADATNQFSSYLGYQLIW